ncbi:AtuA-related protein [Skermanella stibiiresistens]|uniref:AtuA-related protein n=1 Tax=Skermanella stibiiresistens TaxID=913326 RepID=UPI0004B8174D
MRIRLHEIAHCRAGDKGDTSTLSLFAFDEADYPLLCREVTGDRVKRHLSRTIKGDVARFEMPNVSALQFVCQHALRGGVTTSLAIDPHGKCLSSELLELEIDVTDS